MGCGCRLWLDRTPMDADGGADCGSIALPWMRTRVQGDRDAIALHPTRY
ncbi:MULTISPECIES: hypothetical protein [unclassified Microcoleus]|nr:MULTISPECIES: hypothetical protein [unclassified Microcoleus]